MQSTGELRGIEQLDQLGIKDKNILIVEDIIDSGLTMKLTLEKVKSLQPKNLKVAVAFHKKTPNKIHIQNYFADYTGFLISN